MKQLRYAWQLVSAAHPYFSNLPLNAAWQAPVPPAVRAAIGEGAIRVFDIGARRFSYHEIDAIADLVDYTAFDADEEECAKLAKAPLKHGKQRVVAAYVGEEGVDIDFHLYKSPGSSSTFPPDRRFAEQFANSGQATIDRTCRLHSRSLDSLVQQHGIGYPHLLKIDTQGSELAILKAAPQTLENCLMIELEAEFIHQYEGQPLFHDLCSFLYNQGFELYHINRIYKQRANIYSGLSRGQLLAGDFIFFKAESSWGRLSPKDAAALCVLQWAFGHRDAAYRVYQTRLAEHAPYRALTELFETRNYTGWFNRGLQMIVGKLDALVAVYLLLRKSNRLRTEQDRPWPTR